MVKKCKHEKMIKSNLKRAKKLNVSNNFYEYFINVSFSTMKPLNKNVIVIQVTKLFGKESSFIY